MDARNKNNNNQVPYKKRSNYTGDNSFQTSKRNNDLNRQVQKEKSKNEMSNISKINYKTMILESNKKNSLIGSQKKNIVTSSKTNQIDKSSSKKDNNIKEKNNSNEGGNKIIEGNQGPQKTFENERNQNNNKGNTLSNYNLNSFIGNSNTSIINKSNQKKSNINPNTSNQKYLNIQINKDPVKIVYNKNKEDKDTYNGINKKENTSEIENHLNSENSKPEIKDINKNTNINILETNNQSNSENTKAKKKDINNDNKSLKNEFNRKK